MSLIDYIGFALILCLCYIGFQKGVTRKSVFLLTFLFSVLLFYFSFDLVNRFLFALLGSIALAGILSFCVIMLPSFTLFYFGLNRLLGARYFSKGYSLVSVRLRVSSRILGCALGFTSGYIFLTSLIVLSVSSIKARCPSCVLPQLIEDSIFFSVTKGSSISLYDSDYIKTDNMPALKFLLSKENIEHFGFSPIDVENLRKIIKGISNNATIFLVQKKSEGASDRDILILLIQSYEKERPQIETEFLINPSTSQEIQKRLLLNQTSEFRKKTVDVQDIISQEQ